ncbi:serine threonine kinase [Fusarium albosuccineum]|uniref:Serine threonine kinase n=1 Tax=Fusarium albosuccineum TaxID=1237068 RepID=A0A8H4KW03_9HYPO|nr:serine threonine kinase [Fusarium albosuccineum]
MRSSNSELAKSLSDRLRNSMVNQRCADKRFPPNSCWDGLLKKAEVEATLRAKGVDLKPDLVDFILKKACKTFAILVHMRVPELITAIHEHDSREEIFPVQEESLNKLIPVSNWTDELIEEFCVVKQWWFTSPTFTWEQFRYKFEERYHLPFTAYGDSVGDSNYSTVFKRSIHIGHVKLGPDQLCAKDKDGNLRVAVKKLTSSDPDLADREATTLEMMRQSKSDHLIKAIAYYRYMENETAYHHFMFPWAEHGNLWELWMKDTAASLEDNDFIWVFKQLTGQATAIEHLHGQHNSLNRRHGDLKPENILCFEEGDGSSSSRPAVRLVITDVGLAKAHNGATQFREATSTTVSTKRYAGPEMEATPGAPLSRRFDIWSMGCLLVEFVTWMLYGKEELDKCTRATPTTFYELKRDKRGRVKSADVHSTVKKWVSFMQKDLRCSKGTALGRLMDLIVHKLLVVNLMGPAGTPKSTSPHINSRPTQKAANSKKIQPSKKSKYRIYAPDMKQELDSILRDLKENKIQAIRKTPSGSSKTFKGPSTSLPSPQRNTLAQGPSLTESWIYTHDDDFPNDFFRDADLATATPRLGQAQLCSRCRGLSLCSIDCSFTDSRSGLDTKAQGENCELCSLLSYCIRDRSQSSEEVIHFTRAGSYLTIDDGKEHPVIDLCTAPGPNVISVKNVKTSFSTLPEPGSEAHFKVLREWICACDSDHDCIPNQLNFLPTRLIDVSEAESDVLRLIDNESVLNRPQRYAALSHRWGSPKHQEQFCATKANLKELNGGFKTSDLPKTFWDAVHVTRGLHLKYLWIDSLCIIQNDSHDWDVESKRMEQVFSSSYCTLAASCASDTSDGFLKPWPKRRCVPMTVGGAVYYACETIDDFYTHVDQSGLNQRGWVLQERALSRRTIYFAENQSYWECGGGVRCGTMTKMRNRKASFLGDSNFPRSAEQYVKGLKIEFFQDLYVRYSKLGLSFASDRPVAIRGLETRLINTFNTTGGFGLFDLYLHRSLLWKREGASLSRITITQGHTVPSWSWMAYSGAINYLPVPGGKVSWLTDIKSPFYTALKATTYDGGREAPALEAPVWGMCIGNDMERVKGMIFLDEPGRTITEPKECVVLGRGNSEPLAESQAHWVILVHCISKKADASASQVYERRGVAVLERRHIDFQGEVKYGKIR